MVKSIKDEGIDVFYYPKVIKTDLTKSLFANLMDEANWHRPEINRLEQVLAYPKRCSDTFLCR